MLTDAELDELYSFGKCHDGEFPWVSHKIPQLVREHRALKAEAVKALDQVSNLRVTCPKLAALVNACEETSNGRDLAEQS